MSRRMFVGRGLGAVAGLALGPGRLVGATEPGQWRATASATPLELAQEAWRWIQASAVVTDRGISWPADPLDPSSLGRTLYSHGTGVLPFALELFHATGDEEVLESQRPSGVV